MILFMTHKPMENNFATLVQWSFWDWTHGISNANGKFVSKE